MHNIAPLMEIQTDGQQELHRETHKHESYERVFLLLSHGKFRFRNVFSCIFQATSAKKSIHRHIN